MTCVIHYFITKFTTEIDVIPWGPFKWTKNVVWNEHVPGEYNFTDFNWKLYYINFTDEILCKIHKLCRSLPNLPIIVLCEKYGI